MDDSICIEYLDGELNTLFKTKAIYVPRLGNKIIIDDTSYVVIDIESYFYTQDCKRNKIRVYLEHLKD